MEEVKTLTQQMAELPDDQVVYIGSFSGFFFCGTKDEYEASIDVVSAGLLLDMKRKQSKLARKKRLLYDLWGQLTECMTAVLANPEAYPAYPKTAKLLTSLGALAGEMPKVNRRLPEVEKNIAEFRPVRERIVREFYSRLNPDDGVNIIVEGCEHGRYWTLDEYRNGVIPSEDEGDIEDE